MIKQTTVTAGQIACSGVPEITVAGAGRLKLRNFKGNILVSLFTMNGALVYRTRISSPSMILVPPSVVRSGFYIVTIARNKAVYHRQVIMP